MNTEQLIQQEANNYASGKAINGVDAKIVRKDFISGATFGASLNKPTQTDESLEKISTDYAERVCNGQFPITYNRDQVVKHTADDFKEGWKRCIDENKDLWFNAGAMAERIIKNDNGWVKITPETMPTEDDADDNGRVEVWHMYGKFSETTSYRTIALTLPLRSNKYSHWRKIVKP